MSKKLKAEVVAAIVVEIRNNTGMTWAVATKLLPDATSDQKLALILQAHRLCK